MTKISIVTPSYNLDRFISETIESVISQEGNFDLEYIVIDGKSSDKSVEIIKKYESLIKNGEWPTKCNSIDFKWISAKDHGMYDAINKGFEIATGEIYAWLNADDMYQKGALQTMVEVMERFPEISWAKGLVDSVESDGQFIKTSPLRIFHQDWLAKGAYGTVAYFVEQDSVFWRSKIWKSKGKIPEKYRYAGDYWVWLQFAKKEKLWTINAPISVFRKRADQLSQNMNLYKKEQMDVIGTYKTYHPDMVAIRIFFNIWKRPWSPKNAMSAFYKKVLRGGKKDFYLEKINGNFVKKESSFFIVQR